MNHFVIHVKSDIHRTENSYLLKTNWKSEQKIDDITFS